MASQPRPSAQPEHNDASVTTPVPEADPSVKYPSAPGYQCLGPKPLGSGYYGEVWLARSSKNKELVAVKFLSRDKLQGNRYIEGELVNHMKLRHPHIIEFRECFLTSQHLCLVMEYANAGMLWDHVKKKGRLSEVECRWFFQQICFAVDYCHKRGVAVRDIKLENILLHLQPNAFRLQTKLCDFGLSKSSVYRSESKTLVGTPVYMAPEVLQRNPGGYDGKLADVWSLGVVMFAMLFGRLPFWCDKNVPQREQQVLRKILTKQFTFPPEVPVSPEVQDMLTKMLDYAPERLSLEDVMVHPWFQIGMPKAQDGEILSPAVWNRQHIAAQDANNAGFAPQSQNADDIRKLLEAAQAPVSSGFKETFLNHLNC